MKKSAGLLIGILMVFGVVGSANATQLFQDDFESGLTKWSALNGQIVSDPFDGTNNVLNFSVNASGGDTYSMSAFTVVAPGTFFSSHRVNSFRLVWTI